MTRSLRWSLLVVAVFALVLAACGDDEASDEPAITGSTAPVSTTSTSAAPESTTTAPDATTSSTTDPDTVTSPADEGSNVYWAWTVDTTSAATPEQLGAGGRPELWRDDAFAPRNALDALIAGPDELESEIGMTSEIPAGTTVLDLVIEEGVATVDLSSDFNATAGTLGETLAVAQVVFTLTQFDHVDAVSFKIDGTEVDAVGSHGFDVSEPVTREGFDDSVRPLILVESPTPGTEIGDEVVIRGEANTFEANVRYTVTDGDGLIVAEGFTTATAGNGTWGTFEETVAVEFETPGVGAVIVWEESAEDGSQINVVEYPVDVGAAT